MADPYVISFDGSGHQITGVRDVWPNGILFRVKRGEETFYFGCTMSNQAAIGFQDLDRDQIEAMLTAAGLDELERRLRAGIYPPEESDYDNVLFTSEQYEHLRAMVDREKDCLWQERLARGWICTATRPGGDERTSAPLCGGCLIPDERILCTHLMHPTIDALGKGRIKVRAVVESPLCNIGKDPDDGAKCHLGGLECARRIVSTRQALPEPPADVARRAADEVDFFSLVYRDRYGSRI
ncbi:MAG TPA: hypothetical protein VGJ27_05680 [Gaiellaceae bacterium]